MAECLSSLHDAIISVLTMTRKNTKTSQKDIIIFKGKLCPVTLKVI